MSLQAKAIQFLFPLQVYEDDALPKKVCIICVQQIRSAFFFKEQAENSFRVFCKKLNLTDASFVTKVKDEGVASDETPAGNQLPVIMAPRTIECSYSEDMLVEMEA